MANILYNIGGFCAKHSKKILGMWLVLILLVLSIGVILKPSFTSEMSIPNTPSEKAKDIIEKQFPSGDEKGKMQLIVKTKDNDKISRPVIKSVMKDINKDNNVESITDPFVTGSINEKQNIGYIDITYNKSKDKLNQKSLEIIKDNSKYLNEKGMIASYTGDLLPFNLEIGGISEIIGIGMAFLILSITFGSLLVAGMPILISIIGLVTSIGITLITTQLFNISSFSLSLSVMIGLAVGIDYALFIFSKHKQQIKNGVPLNESIKLANGTAGSAVIFAGLTVVVALVSLCTIGIPFLGVMGMVAALSVIFAVLGAITISPAILNLLSTRIIKTKQNEGEVKKEKYQTNFWGRFIIKHPIKIVISSILILIIISIPIKDMFLGLPDDGMKSKDSQNRISYDLMSEGFGKGVNGPLTILAKNSEENAPQKQKLAEYQKISKKISNLENVENVNSVIPSKNSKYAIMTAIPKSGPNDEETAELVQDIRDLSGKDNSKVSFNVTGITAINIDIGDKLNEAIPLFITIIVGFAFIILLTVFRSLFIPIIAVAGFLLTLSSTLGFSVFTLQYGHLNSILGIPEKGPILAFLPILVIGILFGLAMDYQVFLMSKMHEEYIKSKNALFSLEIGMKYNGPVVTAAGLIMLFVFGGFIFAGDIMIKSMGIALTFGVLFDAFVIRLTLIPALMKLAGDKAWYLPKWLDKMLPNVDIEGSKIQK